MHNKNMGDAATMPRSPLIERSRREYEAILVAYPGTQLGVAFGVLNPDGSCQYVSGRTQWKIIEPHLKKIDLFVGCYQTTLEEAQAHELVLEAKKYGCTTSVEHAVFNGLQVQIPTKYQRAARTLERLVRPRGYETKRLGWFNPKYMMQMLPRLGEKL